MGKLSKFAVVTEAVMIIAGVGLFLAWGPATVRSAGLNSTGEVPGELKGKIPKRAETFVFGDFTSFAKSMLRDRPPEVSLQCASVLYTLGTKGHKFRAKEFPRSLKEWRKTGALLFEYPLLKDASGSLPADFANDEGVRQRWLEKASPGTFFVQHKGPHKGKDGKVMSEIFFVGCTVAPSRFKRTPFAVYIEAIPDEAPGGLLERLSALPSEVARDMREEEESAVWTSRAWQLRFAYASYVLAKGRYPKAVSDLEEMAGKRIEKAWSDEVLNAYVEKFFMPAARKAFEGAGFIVPQM